MFICPNAAAEENLSHNFQEQQAVVFSRKDYKKEKESVEWSIKQIKSQMVPSGVGGDQN